MFKHCHLGLDNSAITLSRPLPHVHVLFSFHLNFMHKITCIAKKTVENKIIIPLQNCKLTDLHTGMHHVLNKINMHT